VSSGSTDLPAGSAARAAVPAAVPTDGPPPDVRAAAGMPPAVPPPAVPPTEERPRRWERPVWAAPDPSDVDEAGPRRRPGRRGLVALVVVAAVVLVGSVAIEWLGRRAVTDRVADQLRASGITGEIDVEVTGGLRPVVLRVLAGRGLDELSIRVTDGTIGGLPVARADYRLTDLDVDVSLWSRTVWVDSIGEGDVRIEVLPAALSSTVGTELAIVDGRMTAGPDRLPVTTLVRGDVLVLSGPAEALWGAPVELPLADDYLLPCRPRVTVTGSMLVLACRGSDLPGVLEAPLGPGADPGSAPDGSLVPAQSTVLDGGTTTVLTPTTPSTTAAPPTTAPPEATAPPAPVEPAPPPEVVPAPAPAPPPEGPPPG
jgi:hypothetical protein